MEKEGKVFLKKLKIGFAVKKISWNFALSNQHCEQKNMRKTEVEKTIINKTPERYGC